MHILILVIIPRLFNLIVRRGLVISSLFEYKKIYLVRPFYGKIIQSSSGPRHLFTIPLKDSHLFKITESSN